MKTPVHIFWFRRDLRLKDNAALYHALRENVPVVPVFIFDRQILDRLENKKDARVEFIDQSIRHLQKELLRLGSSLEVYYGKPLEVFGLLAEKYAVHKVFANEDYEPDARDRDNAVERMLKEKSISFNTYKDQVIFSKAEVIKDDGSPYTVFTPYSNKWKNILQQKPEFYFRPYPVEKYFGRFFQQTEKHLPSLSTMGFSKSGISFPSSTTNEEGIKNYAAQRDYPGMDTTSRLGIHLRFGTISIRALAVVAAKLDAVFLNELIWREFYQMILWHFPDMGRGRAFKKAYENIPWRNNELEFAAWCTGQTGYPLVDAGMRQLNETGFMHNRVRMVTASFLSKHLLIDWRWGEAYFAEKLLDFDLASNNGGWQWAAGSGCDAAPYFRIFNPALQQKKFDPAGTYIKKWLPEYQQLNYPSPIVDHVFARERAISIYKKTLNAHR